MVDWYAVATDRRGLEYVAKPLTMVVLFAAAASLDPLNRRAWVAVLVALAFSLAGDVWLMLPGERWFVAGLGSFLVAHVAYVVAFWISGVSWPAFAVGVVVVLVAMASLGRRIVSAVAHSDHPDLKPPVAGYIVVISLMVASAIGTRAGLVIVGAGLFYCSDALIAWTRFVRDFRHGRLAVMVTYHLAQILLVLSLY
jgi:uncharacterized membrane protein YhhN